MFDVKAQIQPVELTDGKLAKAPEAPVGDLSVIDLPADGIVGKANVRRFTRFLSIGIADQKFAIHVPTANGAWLVDLKGQECVLVVLRSESLAQFRMNPRESNSSVLQGIKGSHPDLWVKIQEFQGMSRELDRVVGEITAISGGECSARTPAIVILSAYDQARSESFLSPPGPGMARLVEELRKLGFWGQKGPAEEVEELVVRFAQLDNMALHGMQVEEIAEKAQIDLAQVRAFLDGASLAEMVGRAEFERLSNSACAPWAPKAKFWELGYLLGRFWLSDGPLNQITHHDPKVVSRWKEMATAATLTTRIDSLEPSGGTPLGTTLRVKTNGFERFVDQLRGEKTTLPRILLDGKSRLGLIRAILDVGFTWRDDQLTFSGNESLRDEIVALLGCFRIYPTISPSDPSTIVIHDTSDFLEIFEQRLTLEPERYSKVRIRAHSGLGGSRFPEQKYLKAMEAVHKRGITGANVDNPENCVYTDEIAAESGVNNATLRSWVLTQPPRMARRAALQEAIRTLLNAARE
jgi:hypothetical protein